MRDPIYRHGQFVWRELHSNDIRKSVDFYAEVLGYTSKTMRMPDGTDYTLLTLGEKPVGGLTKSSAPGSPSHWSLSVSVDDVDASATRANDAGGKVLVPPMDAGGMGRLATFLDPSGGALSAWKSNQGDGERPRDHRPRSGEFCWAQLNAADPSVTTFYQKVFGWGEVPFAGGGDMTVFTAGDIQVASVVKAPPGVPTYWLTYVVVDKLTDAHKRVVANGGKVLVEQIDVPTVGVIGVIEDNVGGVLGFFEGPPS